MAAQSSPRKSCTASPFTTTTNNSNTTKSYAGMQSSSSVDSARRKSVVSDPEEMLLLREKLTQIAVGLRFSRDALGDKNDDEDDEERERRSHRPGRGGHFKVFPLLGDRPSTPPSSPQPRDVLRKQLRLRNSSFRLDDLASHQQQRHCPNSSSSSSRGDIDGLCVDAVEITRLDGGHGQRQAAQHVRLSIPSHLRVRSSSSFSVLTKKPEGMRKRKSFHVENRNHEGEDTPLKKVSSQKNVLAEAWDYDGMQTAIPAAADVYAAASCGLQKDHEMDDVNPEATPESPIFTASHGQVSACS